MLHGYPEWYQEQSRNSTQSQRGCGGRNNSSPGRGRGRSNATRTAPNTFSGNTIATSDQIASLISLLQNQQSQLSTERVSGKPSITDVIIDTGASHHMTRDLSLLRDIHETTPSMVKFPDGRSSKPTKSGTLFFNSQCSCSTCYTFQTLTAL